MEPDPEVYWVLPRRLAGRPGPGYRPWDLGALRAMGIGTIVSLDDRGVDRGAIEAAGLKHIRMPLEDFAAPDPEQMETFCRLVDAEGAAGRAVLAHCFAGRGRTGTIAAAYLIWRGASSREAIEAIRRLKERAIEAPEQEEALASFGEVLGRRGRGAPRGLGIK